MTFSSKDTSFNEIIGYENIVEELEHILELMEQSRKENEQPLPLPTGVLIYGQKGMGKTLLMRTIEEEARVPVHTLYASTMSLDDEDAMKETINAAFDKAIESEPSVLLIDDLERFLDDGDFADAVKTFKYRLVALWENKEIIHNVLPIATTSKISVSDLVNRTGRFERHFNLPRHGAHNRIELIQHMIDKLGFEVEPSLERVNHIYFNASPGDIGHQLRLAMQLALKNTNKAIIREKDFLEARERAKSGMRTPESRVFPSEIWRTAIHEAGHTVASFSSLYKDTFVQVSIIPTDYASGHASYGLEGLIEQDDTEDSYMDLLMRLFAGAHAEKLFFGQHSTGSMNDIKNATTIASQMVYEYGMSDLGLRNYTGEMSYGDSVPLSPDMKLKVDEQINALLKKAEDKAENILKTNKSLVEAIGEELFERKILFKEDIDALIENIGFKMPSEYTDS